MHSMLSVKDAILLRHPPRCRSEAVSHRKLTALAHLTRLQAALRLLIARSRVSRRSGGDRPAAAR